MAGFGGIAAVGTSLQRFLNAAFAEQQPIPNRTSRAVLVRTSDFEPQNVASLIGSNALTIFLYRVDFDKFRAGSDSLAATILTFQGDGDYAGVGAFQQSYGVVTAQAQGDLARLAALKIPVDVIFDQGQP